MLGSAETDFFKTATQTASPVTAKRQCKERGWSINNLAMEALLTQSTLNNLYARKAEPKLSTLRAICNAFGISLAEFFADDAEEKKEETLSIDAEIIRHVVDLNKEQKAALWVLLKSIR